MPGGWCLFALSLPVMIMVKVWQKKFAQALWAGSGDGPGHLGSEVAFHRQPGKPHTQTHTNTDTDTGTNTNTNTHTHRHPLDLHSLAEEGAHAIGSRGIRFLRVSANTITEVPIQRQAAQSIPPQTATQSHS